MATRTSILELRSVRCTGGGPEKTILSGAARHDRARFDVTVCYVRDFRDDVFALRQRARGLDLDYVEIPERGSVDPRIWRQLCRLVADRRIDLVHAHDYKTDLLALALARRLGVVPLATAHGWTGQAARERYLYYPLDKRLLGRFPRVIAVSADIRRELVRCGAHPDRVTVILNGIDPVEFRRTPGRRETVRVQLGYRPEHFVIGAVGRIERQKRFDHLVEAFAALAHHHPLMRLAIAGAGSLEPELTRLIESRGLTERARLLGHRDDVAELHHAMDVFVQSSEYEGTPNAVLEAMALETPIVATDAGGTSEVATPQTEALIVPIGDVNALVNAIRTVRDDQPAARARAIAARRRVENALSFDARTRRLEAVYLELVADPSGARAIPVSSRLHDA
jgi:glycosyltransferase involved in cell wall biosynthesis